VAADGLARLIAEYALGARVPGDDPAAFVQHEYAEVTDAADERPEAVFHRVERALFPLLPGGARERAHHRHEERRGLEERQLIEMARCIRLCREGLAWEERRNSHARNKRGHEAWTEPPIKRAYHYGDERWGVSRAVERVR
jgi:hypothetical protein